MVLIEERILEYLAEHDLATPSTIADAISQTVTDGQVHQRCRVLSHAGFVAPLIDDRTHAELYRITNWGEAYLKGEVDAGLRWPIPAPRPPGKIRPDRWKRRS